MSSAAGDGGGAIGDDDGAESAALDLFGEWQTDAYIPPAACEGIVPRGARGHVELWTAAHLPRGCVLLKSPHVAAVARRLALDFAPAMVGFDYREGRSVPKFDGVVVCAEHAELLSEAAAELADRDMDKRAHLRREQMLGHWRTLLRAINIRMRLEEQYGSVAG